MSPGAAKLVGRGVELEAIERALQAVEAGHAGVLQVAGEPGIGKTRLLGELLDRAETRGHLLLSGRAAEFEREPPFGVFVSALDDHLSTVDPQCLEALGRGAQEELAGVFPALSASAGMRERPGRLQEERYRAHRAVRALLEALSRPRPLVLALDDLHWADPASAELLSHLLRHPPRARLLLAMAFRPAQMPSRFGATLASAAEEGQAEQLEVPRLSQDEADELLGLDLNRRTRARIYRESGGNPFYLLQLSRSTAPPSGGPERDHAGLAAAVPPPVRSAIAGELEGLTARGRTLLEGAAVVGDPFHLDLAAAAAGLLERDALPALDELEAQDLVRATDAARHFRFRHPIVRRAVYESVGTGWRLGAHSRVARRLAGWGAPPPALAHHVEPCAQPGDEAAIGLLTDAGRAVASHAPATAAVWFRAALRLVPDSAASAPRRLELLLSMANALRASGRLEESRDRLREALRLVPAEHLTGRVSLVVACAGLDYLLRRHAKALDLLHQTLAELPDRHSPEAAVLKLAIGGDQVWGADQSAPATWARLALDDARRHADLPIQAAALGLLAMGEWRVGRTDAAVTAMRATRRLMVDMTDEDLARRIDAALWLGWVEAGSERPQDAVDDLERALSIARSDGQGHMLTPLLFGLGYALQWQGRLSCAIERYDEAIEIALLTGAKESHAWATFLRCSAATVAGDTAGALRFGQQARQIAGDSHDLTAAAAGFFLAEARLEAGDPRGCIEQMLASGGGADLPLDERTYRPFWYEVLTRADLTLGHIDAAQAWAARAEENARGLGLSGRTGWAERARAAVLLARGDPGSAADLASSSAARLGVAANPIEQARSRVLAGRALAAAGRTVQAIAELEHAEVELARWGAEGYRQQAARELRRLGRRAPRRDSGRHDGVGLGALTTRELEVARLVGVGRTNREIAATLYLSEKTIERHLAHIFAKLGVSSRAAVAGVVSREPDGFPPE